MLSSPNRSHACIFQTSEKLNHLFHRAETKGSPQDPRYLFVHLILEESNPESHSFFVLIISGLGQKDFRCTAMYVYHCGPYFL